MAKRTEPGIDKVITGGHTTDDKIPEGTMPKNTAGKDVTPTGGSVSNATASVGDVIQYDIRLTIPHWRLSLMGTVVKKQLLRLTPLRQITQK